MTNYNVLAKDLAHARRYNPEQVPGLEARLLAMSRELAAEFREEMAILKRTEPVGESHSPYTGTPARLFRPALADEHLEPYTRRIVSDHVREWQPAPHWQYEWD